MELCRWHSVKYISNICVAYVAPRVHNNRAPLYCYELFVALYAVTLCTTDANRPEKINCYNLFTVHGKVLEWES